MDPTDRENTESAGEGHARPEQPVSTRSSRPPLDSGDAVGHGPSHAKSTAPPPSFDKTPSSPHPLAFARGTGIVFQSVGLFMCFASCCAGSFFGLIQTPMREALRGDTPRTVFEAWSAFEVHQKLAAISMFANCAAGLGALAAGIALQSDRYGSARTAVIIALPMALYHLIYVVTVVVRGPWDAWILGPLVLAAVWSGMALLACVSAQRHAQHPPPRGPEKLPPGFKLPMTAGQRMERDLHRKP